MVYATNVLPKDRKNMTDWMPIEGDEHESALSVEEMKEITKKMRKRGR